MRSIAYLGFTLLFGYANAGNSLGTDGCGGSRDTDGDIDSGMPEEEREEGGRALVFHIAPSDEFEHLNDMEPMFTIVCAPVCSNAESSVVGLNHRVDVSWGDTATCTFWEFTMDSACSEDTESLATLALVGVNETFTFYGEGMSGQNEDWGRGFRLVEPENATSIGDVHIDVEINTAWGSDNSLNLHAGSEAGNVAESPVYVWGM
jgi:hypothetical protein